MPGFVGLPELMILGLVALLVFGPKRLPEMGRSLGRGLREFKQSVSTDDEEKRFAVPVEDDVDETARLVVATAPVIPLHDRPLVPPTAPESDRTHSGPKVA